MRREAPTRSRAFFRDGPAAADYALLRDHPDPEFAAARVHIESLWEAFAPHADPDYCIDARVHFRARFWELYLFSVLRAAELQPSGQRGGGPDLILATPSGRAFVEAIAPGVGDKEDRVPDEEYGEIVELPGDEWLLRGGVVELPHRQLLLRLTAAIREKSQKAARYLAKGMVAADEPFIIAINGAVNGYAMTDCRTPKHLQVPRIVQVLYGVGDHTLSFDDRGQVRSHGFTARSSIPKRSGAEVPSGLFRSDSHAHVSGVIFGLEYARSFDLSGRNLLLVHNPFARCPWPRGVLRLGVEYWLQGTTIRWTDWGTEQRGAIDPMTPEARS